MFALCFGYHVGSEGGLFPPEPTPEVERIGPALVVTVEAVS